FHEDTFTGVGSKEKSRRGGDDVATVGWNILAVGKTGQQVLLTADLPGVTADDDASSDRSCRTS
ncbi:MAG: hypothetical protein ACK559_28710, partial [bacterium]